MRFTKRSIRYRRALERKKQLVTILGGKVAATHSTAEVVMRHATPVVKSPAPLSNVDSARLGYARRKARRDAECETIN
jgi:glycerol-3-phosphate dehydrogenase